MARKLKIYQTSQGFFDLVIAAPSMNAALEAWGANSNLFHQGFANEVDDPKTVTAALANPRHSAETPGRQQRAVSRAGTSADQRPTERSATASAETGQKASQSTLTARR